MLDNYKILVIEDNPGDFVLMDCYLHDQIENPQIIHASNFKDAKESLLNPTLDFNVVLMDLSLPDKSGEGLIDEIIALCPTIPVIVLTGYADANLSTRILNKGILAYILKDELTAAILHENIIKALNVKKVVASNNFNCS